MGKHFEVANGLSSGSDECKTVFNPSVSHPACGTSTRSVIGRKSWTLPRFFPSSFPQMKFYGISFVFHGSSSEWCLRRSTQNRERKLDRKSPLIRGWKTSEVISNCRPNANDKTLLAKWVTREAIHAKSFCNSSDAYFRFEPLEKNQPNSMQFPSKLCTNLHRWPRKQQKLREISRGFSLLIFDSFDAQWVCGRSEGLVTRVKNVNYGK